MEAAFIFVRNAAGTALYFWSERIDTECFVKSVVVVADRLAVGRGHGLQLPLPEVPRRVVGVSRRDRGNSRSSPSSDRVSIWSRNCRLAKDGSALGCQGTSLLKKYL